jgi:HEAT repeat protein
MRHIRADEIDDVLDQTHHVDPKKRAEALRQLCPCHLRRNVPEIWTRVFELVEDPEPKVRSNALHLLADGSPREFLTEVVASIDKLTSDSDPKIRRQARRVMSHYHRTGQVNIL